MGNRAKIRSRAGRAQIARKRPAVFLDRDGTIIRQVELPHTPSQLVTLPGAARAVAQLKRLGYFLAIVSNQPVVARGILTPEGAIELNDVLMERLARWGARIDAFYFCPHHPKANMKKFRKVCNCRKPKPGLILRAAREHRLDLKKSFLIGDSTQDVRMGNRARVKMILVRTGYGGKDPWQHAGKPDFVVKNLAAAARLIKELSRTL